MYERFNPRAPGGARQHPILKVRFVWDVSIHAPRAERDLSLAGDIADLKLFQSTRPGRSATRPFLVNPSIPGVSIHAPRAERDTCARGL